MIGADYAPFEPAMQADIGGLLRAYITETGAGTRITLVMHEHLARWLDPKSTGFVSVSAALRDGSVAFRLDRKPGAMVQLLPHGKKGKGRLVIQMDDHPARLGISSEVPDILKMEREAIELGFAMSGPPWALSVRASPGLTLEAFSGLSVYHQLEYIAGLERPLLGWEIKALRTARGESQYTFAPMLDINRATLAGWESGRRRCLEHSVNKRLKDLAAQTLGDMTAETPP